MLNSKRFKLKDFFGFSLYQPSFHFPCVCLCVSSFAPRPTEDDIEALREREAIPRGDSHSDDRRWKMNSKDEKEEEEEEEEGGGGAKEAADNQFDDSN